MIEIGYALDAAIALFRRYKALIAIVPLILAVGVQTARIEGFLWFDGFKDKLAKAETTIAQMELASKQARAAQIAANLATEARYRANAEKTDAEYQKELAGALRAADRYAANHGVRQVCRGSTGQAPAAPESPTAPRDNGPGDDAVILSRRNFDILNENTLRLKSVHDWGLSLVREGLASRANSLPDPLFGNVPSGEPVQDVKISPE